MINDVMEDWLRSIAGAEGFEWDGGNAVKSEKKHRVTCEEAEEVFKNRPLLLLDDPAHSHAEPRAKAFGKTDAGRVLTVSFTLRGTLVRVISARPMNRRERRFYEQED